ncbi:CSC1-like protein 1 [Gouania willdenowi]|uniref:CSC1-like protein 1 n=1 Tax=Gouania willdenowi TaxID=441366 RepID=A0A8C5HSZ8_GOUWI|nr:CSC1-like protein 1 [Gouania willdenowi]XP_028295825.1 CSC1-like protein 1 [Gouania willdenowi]
MSSQWEEQWPLVAKNITPFPNSSCFDPKHSTVLTGLDFGGVPVVLLINFCIFVFLLILFSCIRKKVWDYGRLALVADNTGYTESVHRNYGHMSSEGSSMEEPEHEKRCWSWLLYIFRLDDDEIKAKCGMDAVHYLSFQRHLIFLLVIVTIASLAVILPVNMTGDLYKNDLPFGQTTIANLQDGDNLLWLHSVFAVLYLILTVVVLRHHTSKIKGMRRETSRNTLLVSSVPKTATTEDVKTHFTEAYPNCTVCDVTLGYDVKRLIYLDKERIRAGKILHECKLKNTGEQELMNPRLCGQLCCCSSCEKVDAIEFYSTKEKNLLEKVREQVEDVPNHPLGIAFVTLQTEAMAKYILKDFNALECGGSSCCCCCDGKRQSSSMSKTLKVNKWRVIFAPHPKNVFWANLSVPDISWYVRYVAINIFILLLLTFLTTPTIIINTMDKFNVTKPIEYLHSPIISQFFPTLLLWSFSALLPTIVYYSTLGEGHWNRSREQLSMMRKLYFFLLFMVLILPSLGLTSLAVFFRWLFDKEFLNGGKLRFECVFLPDQGAFFVNYVITAALVGSGMELLRLPGLLIYTIRMMCARSAAERKYVKKNQAFEFEYGVTYGWSLCVFTVIMAYSIICPIITPFGLLYMLLKHLVDRYNLVFTFLSARLDRQVHLWAVNQALAAPIICLIWLYFFSVLRTGFWAPTSLFTLVVLCLTVFICLSYTFLNQFKYLSPLNYEIKEEDKDQVELEEEDTMVYLPTVLISKLPARSTHEAKHHLSYGSTEENPVNSSNFVSNSSITAVDGDSSDA